MFGYIINQLYKFWCCVNTKSQSECWGGYLYSIERRNRECLQGAIYSKGLCPNIDYAIYLLTKHSSLLHKWIKCRWKGRGIGLQALKVLFWVICVSTAYCKRIKGWTASNMEGYLLKLPLSLISWCFFNEVASLHRMMGILLFVFLPKFITLVLNINVSNLFIYDYSY